jgi:hypothetical protein
MQKSVNRKGKADERKKKGGLILYLAKDTAGIDYFCHP